MEFKYNPDAKYKPEPKHSEKKEVVLGKLNVFVTENKSFQVPVPNPFDNYLNPDIKRDAVANAWFNSPKAFYQNQLNFAIWCATTGCGVSFANHLNHPDPFIRSVYQFHMYYQMRRVLNEISAPLYNEKSFCYYQNVIDLTAYQRLCDEFQISNNTDFRQRSDKTNGMGTIYLYLVGNEYDGGYQAGYTSFDTRSARPLLYIRQHHPDAWKTFVLDTANGFTRAGIERLNDSIRTYVWCILGSQSQTRTNIIDRQGTSFDAQKQFLANLEDAIHSPVDLPSSIKRYEDTLRYARSKLDFVVGIGLYMLPSDLQLQIGTIIYNNNITIANDDAHLGKNEDVNEKITVHLPYTQLPPQTPPPPSPTPPPPPPTPTTRENMKISLIVMGTIVGIVALWWKKKD